MIAIIVWILELLLMGVLAWFYPDTLIHNNMIGGMMYSILAWIPAIMTQALFD